MKRSIPLIFISLVVGAGCIWLSTHGSLSVAKADADEEKKPAAATEEADKVTISHDTNGNVVVGMSDKIQGSIGLVVTNPAAAEFSPEVKTYGNVVDPAPIAELMTQLAAAEATFDNSHQELERLKALKEQNNASDRALQSAEATYKENMAAAMGIRTKIQLAWGGKLANLSGDLVVPPGTERKPPPALNPLTDGNVLVRLSLPAGESLDSTPETARVVPLGKNADSIIAQYYDEIPAVDPQTLMRSFLFFTTNSLKPGEPVTGYLQTGGEPIKGVIIPRDAVVRVEGKGWVYVLNSGGASFTRTEIPLDHAVENGWFVTAITSNDHVVVTGAQVLLSEELKASMSPD